MDSTSLVELNPRSNQGASKARSKRSLWMQWFMSDSWMLECITMAVSVLALVSIAIMLGLYNNKPLNSWSQIISLNTALSTLGTIMKGFMMVSIGSCLSQLKWLWYARKRRTLHDFEVFDQASRGPWGSSVLLYRLRFWHLASIGAFVTVLALASDSFVQQSVSYPLWNVPQSQLVASVPYAQNYTSYVNGTYGPANAYVGESMMAAIYDGVFSSNLTRSASSIRPTCPSGNCTSPPYASLGVCSKCVDVTRLLQYNMDPGTGLGPAYSWILPNGLSLVNAETGFTYINISSTGLSTGPTDAIRNMSLNSDALSTYITAGTISNISIISTPGNSKQASSTIAQDCTLFFCARSYASSSILNVYTENITDVFETPVWVRSAPDPSPATYEAAFPPATFDAVLLSIKSQSLTFKLDMYAMTALKRALASITGGVGNTAGAQQFYTTDIAQGFFYRGLTSDAVTKTIESLAAALTNVVRQVSNPQTSVTGTTCALESYIVVQWPWLLLPLIMVLLAALFLVLTILQTEKGRVPSWRSSALAVMEHGVSTTMLESGPQHERVDMPGVGHGKESVGELESWATDVNVRLQRRGLSSCGFGLSVT